MKRAGKLLKRTLLGTLILVAALAILTGGFAAWAIRHPERAWRLAERTVLPDDLKVRWRSLDLDVDWVRGLRFKFRWSGRGIEARKFSPKFAVKIEEFAGEIEGTIPKLPIAVHRFRLRSKEPLQFWEPRPSADSESAEENPYEIAQNAIETVRTLGEKAALGDIEIDLRDLRYHPRAVDPYRGSLVVRNAQADSLELDARVAGLGPELRELALSGTGGGTPGGYRFQGRFRLKGSSLDVTAPIRLARSGETLTLDTDPDFRMKLSERTLRTKPRIRVAMRPREITAAFEGTVRGIPGPVRRLRKVDADFRLPLRPGKSWDAEPVSFRVRAGVPLFFVSRRDRATVEQICGCRLPRSLPTVLDGTFWFAGLSARGKGKRIVADLALEMESVANSALSLDLGATAKIYRQGGRWVFEPTLDSDVEIREFQALRSVLETKKIMVPAPFHVLDGTLALHLKSPVEWRRAELGAPADITTLARMEADLKSERQSVQFTAEVLMGMPEDFSSLNADVKARIERIQVELPPLNPLVRMPRLARDSRIRSEPRKRGRRKPDEFRFTMNLEIDTASPGAIRLLSPLARPYVPITVHVHTSKESGSAGTLTVEPFEVHYLRRTVFVDSLSLDLSRGDADGFPIRGELHVNQTEYKVMIHLAGTTDAPQIKFSSDPYLDNDDIVSVLLFDRTSDELVDADSETSGNVQAAIADRAVGLFGLWAFASTPIRSFSYNAVTKTYSATVVIGEGLTAGIGTTSDQSANFEVRKRLSRRWAVTASWKPEGEEDRAGRVVLQWENRF